MKYKLSATDLFRQPVTVVVSLDTPDGDPDAAAAIAYEGGDYEVDLVKAQLYRCGGYYGHSISDITTALDLAAAMLKPPMAEFSPQLVEGTIPKARPLPLGVRS